jgi:hypothetical protein
LIFTTVNYVFSFSRNGLTLLHNARFAWLNRNRNAQKRLAHSYLFDSDHTTRLTSDTFVSYKPAVRFYSLTETA